MSATGTTPRELNKGNFLFHLLKSDFLSKPESFAYRALLEGKAEDEVVDTMYHDARKTAIKAGMRRLSDFETEFRRFQSQFSALNQIQALRPRKGPSLSRKPIYLHAVADGIGDDFQNMPTPLLYKDEKFAQPSPAPSCRANYICNRLRVSTARKKGFISNSQEIKSLVEDSTPLFFLIHAKVL